MKCKFCKTKMISVVQQVAKDNRLIYEELSCPKCMATLKIGDKS